MCACVCVCVCVCVLVLVCMAVCGGMSGCMYIALCTGCRKRCETEVEQGEDDNLEKSSSVRDEQNKDDISSICDALSVALGKSNAKVWPAKKYLKLEDKISDVTTLVVMLKNTQTETDFVSEFKGYPVHYVNYPSLSLDCIHSLKSDASLSAKEDKTIGDIITKHFNALSKRHSNMTRMRPSAVKIRNGKVIQEKCISISCTGKGFVPNGEKLFPSEIDGIKVDIFEGSIIPCMDERHEPLHVSCSVSHKDSYSYGTLGGFCSETDDEEGGSIEGLITCLHCVLPSETKYVADVMDGIVVQPGTLLGGFKLENECGTVKSWRLCHAPYNGKDFYMDAAFIEMDKGRISNTSQFCNNLLEVNQTLFETFLGTEFSFSSVIIHEPFEEIPDNKVFKLGQRTGLTVGKVTSQYENGVIEYSNNLKRNYCNVVGIAPRGGSQFARKGDSGSLVFYVKNGKPHLVGIIFACDNNDIGKAYACHIKPVLQEMNLQFP